MTRSRARATRRGERELINDPGETMQERVSRVVEEFLSGNEKKGKKGMILPLPSAKSRTPRTTEAISRALAAAGGRVSYAAIILGMTPKSLRRRIQDSEELTSLRDEIQEFRIDIAESKLDKKVLEEKYPAIQFLLESQGKSRGYTKRTEVTGAEGGKLVFEFSDGSVDKDV